MVTKQRPSDGQDPAPDPQAAAAEAEARLAGFVAQYSPDIGRQLMACRRRLQALVPRGYELVYDNYNALAIGYATTDKAGGAVISVAAYPRWVTLFLLHGAGLPDPERLLQGSGSRVRSIRLRGPEDLDRPAVQTLLALALAPAAAAFAQAPPLSLLIKSVSPKQRPRQPSPNADRGH